MQAQAMVNNKDNIEIIEMLFARSTIHIHVHTHILVICILHCTPSTPIQCSQGMSQAVPSIPHQLRQKAPQATPYRVPQECPKLSPAFPISRPRSPGNPHGEDMGAAWGLPNLGNGECYGEGLGKLGAKACSLSASASRRPRCRCNCCLHVQ